MKKVLILIILILCLAGGGFAVWHTLDVNVFSDSQLPENTTINGVNCNGLTTDQAKGKLIREWNSNSFSFTKEGSAIGTINDLDFTYDIDESMASIKKDNFISAAMNYFLRWISPYPFL